MNPRSRPSARPSRFAARILSALALSASALPVFGAASLTFDTDAQGVAGDGAAWSSKFGGSVALTVGGNWGVAGNLNPAGDFYNELVTCMSNGGVLSFDIIVDSDGLEAGDSVTPYVAANSAAGWDQENAVTITASQTAGGPVTIHVTKVVMPAGTAIGGNGELQFSPTGGWFQLFFGRTESAGSNTYHIDNLTLTANSTPLDAPKPYDPEVVKFDADAEGFAAISWDSAPQAVTAHSSSFGGALKFTVPAASETKEFWWIAGGSMSAKFATKLNAAITGGGVVSYDLIAPSGTLAGITPFIYFQQSSGTWDWKQIGGATIPAANITDIGGGFEKTTIELAVSAFGFLTTAPYASIGFGVARATDAPAIEYYLDNVTITPAQRSAALSFDTDTEHFAPNIDSHSTAADSIAASAVLVVADATGLSVGMIASGNVNLPEGATITAIAGTSVTLSAAALSTEAGAQTTFTAPVNPAAVWSGTYGGTLAVTAPGGAGEQNRWVAQSNLNDEAHFNAALNKALSLGGTVSYDLIADTGVLSTLKPALFLQQQAGAWNWVSNEAGAAFVSPDDIVALPSGRELVRVVVPTAAFATSGPDAYSLLGLGVTYTSAAPVSFHFDNLLVETALTETSAALTFDTSAEDFVLYQLGSVVHLDRADVGASGNGKAILVGGAPRGQQWLARTVLGTGSTGAEAEAVGAQLALAAANGGSLTFDVIVDDLSVTAPTVDFAAAGLGVKLSLQAAGDAFQQQEFAFPGVTLPLAEGQSAVVTLTVPLYKAGSTATDGFVLGADTEFELLVGSVCPETPVVTADTTTTADSAIVTLADTTGITAGLGVTGAGLPNGVTVATVDSATQLTLSANATATGVATGAVYARQVATRVEFFIDNLQVTANPEVIAPVIAGAPSINLDGQWVAGRVLAAYAAGATYSATGLPPGLSLDSATGVLSGKPTANGTFTVTFTVTTAAGSSSVEVSWSVTGAGTPNLVVTSFTVVGGAATIQWSGAGGAPVNVQRSTDLADWENIATGLTAETHTDATAPTPRAFYRVVIP